MSEQVITGQDVGGTRLTREKRVVGGTADSRVYVTETGNWYPSVSTILDSRTNPEKEHALRNWRQKHDGTGGTEHYSAILNVKSNFGTLAHYAVLSPFTERDLWTEDEQRAKQALQDHGDFRGKDAWNWARQRFQLVQDGFYRALNEDKITGIVGVERYVLNRESGYAGQYDLIYTRKGPSGEETVLCDLKTGSGIYDQHEMQLAAYANAAPIEIDHLKIVRSHPDGAEIELEVRTDDEFDVAWPRRFQQFQTSAVALQRRITNQRRHSEEKGPTTSQSSSVRNETAEDPDDSDVNMTIEKDSKSEAGDVQDRIAGVVDQYVGSPIGMGQQFRSVVDKGEIPDLIETELGGIPSADRDHVLERLDDLLPAPKGSDTKPQSDEAPVSSSDESEVALSKGALETTTRGLSGENDESSSDLVELPPALLALVDAAVSHEEYADSRTDLVEAALTTTLATTIGSEIDPSRFKTTAQTDLSIDVDPVYKQLFALPAENENPQDGKQSVENALREELGIRADKQRIRVENFDRYRFVIDTLVDDKACPCESPGEVLQAALESYLNV